MLPLWSQSYSNWVILPILLACRACGSGSAALGFFSSARRKRKSVYLRAWCIFQDIWLVSLHLHYCVSFLQMSHFSSFFFLFYFYHIFINQRIRLTFRSHTLYHLTQGPMKGRGTDYWCKQMFLITEGFRFAVDF